MSGLNGTSSDVWDKLASGHWVADYYVDTPGTEGAFSPPIPRCGAPKDAVVTTTCNPTSSRPQQFTLFCNASIADHQEYVGRIHWSSFGGSRARGRGTLYVQTCDPSCEGTHNFLHYRVHVLLSRPRFCSAWKRYEYMAGLVTSKRAPGTLRRIHLNPYCGVRKLPELSYQALDGHTETLQPWQGGHVTVLTELGTPRDRGAMTTWVGGLDRAWNYYVAMTGRTPGDDPKLTVPHRLNGRDFVAEVTSSCGAGCTTPGDYGTEIVNCPGSAPNCAYFDYDYNEVAQHGLFDQIPFYEMGHSFWFWFPQLAFQEPPNARSDWQDPAVFGQAIWMRFASMAAAQVPGAPPIDTQTPFSLYRYEVTSLAGEYEASPSRTFAETLAQDRAPGTQMCGSGNCAGSDFWASLMMQLAARHGGDAFISRFWRDIGQQPQESSDAGEVTNWEHAASEAACTDLSSVFYTRWGFPRPDGSVTKRPAANTVPEPVGSCGTG